MEQAAGDVFVITGIGGMGEAAARRIGAGMQLVLADRSADHLARRAEQLRQDGYAVHEVELDVADRGSVGRLAARAAGLGRVWTILHTAGATPVDTPADRIFAVDVLGTAHVLDAFEPHVGPGSVAVCIASMAGTMTQLPPDVEAAMATTPTAELGALAVFDPGTDPGTAYGIAKRANQLRVQAAAVAWGRRGARVVSISPGIIATPNGRAELDGPSGDFMRQMIDMSPAGRIGLAEDIAKAVEFLTSPAASFITGTDLLVDGGVIAALRHGATLAG